MKIQDQSMSRQNKDYILFELTDDFLDKVYPDLDKPSRKRFKTIEHCEGCGTDLAENGRRINSRGIKNDIVCQSCYDALYQLRIMKNFNKNSKILDI